MFRRLTPPQLTIDVALAVVALSLRVAYGVFSPAQAAVIFGMAAALAIRRLSPGLALAVAWVFALLQMVTLQPPDVANVAILAVLYCTSRYGTAVVKWLGLTSAIVGAVVATGYTLFNPFTGFSITATISFGATEVARIAFAAALGFAAALAVLGLSWTLGLLNKTWATAREAREREQNAARSVVVEQERNRIARDMHDVVAHSLAVVIAQADGGRYTLEVASKDHALATISSTAREALTDVRLLLAQLRHNQEAGPQPTVADLDQLIDQLRASGLLVELMVSGTPLGVPASQQLAIYRIVQEALTNALRHGDSAKTVHVAIQWSADAATLDITSALRNSAPRSASPGHGIAGMHERALLVGGTLTATSVEETFMVHAIIPARSSVAAA